ncbi:uncharacterized protein LOC126377018 [Pectinophora gossypiella]|uniref:uncharacterized protein LOC126377018 n=1 Tax=Pectinophora gossypiella TaxID=13191 RepID=UPI00214F3DB0|nr:uncharacterized protein LOC126377018 [Pectinophora gossypiella]
MSDLSLQRDLVISLKRETLLNIGILSKLHPMSSDLSRMLKENCLEKPTQNVFNHLAHYLVCIIDPQVTLPWPLYDSKTERTYRNELSVFVADYSSKSLLSPVMSSYFVNPNCYKVTLLMFQMSQLAVQRVLLMKMDKEHQKKLFNEMTEKYKSQKEEGFIESIEKETEIMLSKFSNYLRKREIMEKIAKKLRDRITQMENKLKTTNAQGFIDNLVDGYVKKHSLDEDTKMEILKIKNINQSVPFFDKWLADLDKQMDVMESNWDAKMSPFLKLSQTTSENTQTLIARQTGEADKKTFTIEFNPKTDDISTLDLQKQVNSQQKYILKNIIKDEKLNFPNLIRGFLISICFILKNMEVGDEIYQFNEYLEGGQRNYSEIVSAMKILVERVMNAEGRLQPQQETFSTFTSSREISEIPPLPDLSDIKMNREFHHQTIFETFTPLHFTKHQFNLRKQRTGFIKPMSKTFATPFHRAPRDDFLKSLISCRVSAYDHMNITQNNNMSVMNHTAHRMNETIAECTSGFTKQQICRLLSTKKTSSSKKMKHKVDRPNIKIKKGGLFNESNISNDSINLIRSHSSPNLFENKEKRSRTNLRSRKLSIMKEDSPSLLEVSGIAALERDSNHSTPQGVISLESTRKLIDASSLPSISMTVTPRSDVSDNPVDLNKELSEFKEPQMIKPIRKSKESFGEAKTVVPQRKSTEIVKEETKTDTPKNNTQIVKKTSSLEKIINRFKKVRASVLPSEGNDENNDFKTIFEEKENLNSVNVDVFTANRNLLPDLLSPSCSLIAPKSNDNFLDQLYFDSDEDKPRKPRESLGTALGVDQTFLDQFDLID